MNEITKALARTAIHIEVDSERGMQDRRWGEQNHKDGTHAVYTMMADRAKEQCAIATELGCVTWMHILSEEIMEAFAETDPAKLRAGLIQVAAVTCAWIEAIDRRVSR